MSSQVVMSSRLASNIPGLCPVKGQKSGLCSWTRACNQLSSLSLGTDKNPPHHHVLVICPAFLGVQLMHSSSYVNKMSHRM